ncbi:hypothetical protein PHET_11414 [Paragonimus heterotremus]|uniref:ATP-dependent RNA helicase n=1 Tax=Paragonimus heterotremus TaxID=100268 RepID=A0A8J4WTA1_9TREM|nr:hypothetical protein PHET_11414 [Paragonimus heterotremus]
MDIWRELYVPEDITTALSKANFTDPTPIQSRVLPSAIRDCADILGAAPTGSGKTLAYGVPLLIRVRDLQLAEVSLYTFFAVYGISFGSIEQHLLTLTARVLRIFRESVHCKLR